MLAMELIRSARNYATDDLPLCPNCGRSMSLERTTPRSGLPDLCVFKCGECGVWLSESTGDRPTV